MKIRTNVKAGRLVGGSTDDFSPILHEPDPDWESRDFSSSCDYQPESDLQGVAAGGRDSGRTTGQL